VERQFDFWQDHSDTFLTMAYLWDRRKTLEQPDGYGRKSGDCGDTITIYLSIKNGIISQVNFELEGCINTNACCNALAILVEGKGIEESWNVTPNDIISFLETLPIDHLHCAELTVGTFYLALADCNEEKNKK
jgi:nitrogen fixation NifU-like protein